MEKASRMAQRPRNGGADRIAPALRLPLRRDEQLRALQPEQSAAHGEGRPRRWQNDVLYVPFLRLLPRVQPLLRPVSLHHLLTDVRRDARLQDGAAPAD